jgi:hypothetical protein
MLTAPGVLHGVGITSLRSPRLPGVLGMSVFASGGPKISRQIGRRSASTVIRNVKNAQNCRSKLGKSSATPMLAVARRSALRHRGSP